MEKQLGHFFSIPRSQLIVFFSCCLIFLVIAILYSINLVRWAHEPNFGWVLDSELGELTFVETTGPAKRSGLNGGDRVIELNGRPVGGLEDLREALDRNVPGENTYQVLRDSQTLKVVVPNAELGLTGSFGRFGLTWGVSIVFLGLGIVVFVLKPGTVTAGAFFLFTLAVGLTIMFTFTSQFKPTWLSGVLLFGRAFIPATMIHLASVIPVRWKHERFRIAVVAGAYCFSMLLFVAMCLHGPIYADLPPLVKRLATVFIVVALSTFVLSLSFYFFKPDSPLTRVRAGAVLLGVLFAALFPVANLIFAAFLQSPIYPAHANWMFFLLFPITVAYSIVQHNLFDANVYILRAVGYVTMTAILGGGYIALQAGANALIIDPLFGEQSRDILPLIYAVLVVLFFNPINNRVKSIIDRMFFRGRFNYKETVSRMRDALRSVLDVQEIMSRVVGALNKEMFLERVGVILIDRETQKCNPYFLTDEHSGKVVDDSNNVCLLPSDPLLSLVEKKKTIVTRYDVDESPEYWAQRETFLARFDELGVTTVVPLLYSDKLIGVLLVGDKKSGKHYDREDIDLLTTVADQSAIAIENARLVEGMKKEATARSNLARYLSPQIVEQVFHHERELDLGGHRKTVSILFSDIRNFSGISETWPPDQLIEILNEYFTEMVAVIFEHKGSVDKYVGDAIIAVFGSLIELDNTAQSAVDAALAMQARMPALNERWRKRYGVEMHMGIGITRGDVFLGNIGSPERMEFTVIGDSVNVASRLSGVARAGEIVVTDAVVEQLSEKIPSRPMEPIMVKGKAEPMQLFLIESADRV